MEARTAVAAGNPGVAQRESPGFPAETDLIREAQKGNREAVTALVRTNWPAVHRAAYFVIGDSHRAEDIAQESILAAIHRLDSFDPDRPFGPWVHRIAVNRAIDLVRSEKARFQPEAGDDVRETAPDLEGGRPATPGGPLVEALAAIEPDDRGLLVLRYVLRYSAVEIGEMQGMPAATVRTRLHRASKRIKSLIGEEDHE